MGHVQITHDKRSLIIHVPRWAYDKYPIHWRQTLAWSRDGDVLHVEIGDGAQGDIRRKTYHKYQTVYLTIPAKYARDLELRNGDHVRCTWREEPRLRLSIYKDEAPLSRYKKHRRIEREGGKERKTRWHRVKEENDRNSRRRWQRSCRNWKNTRRNWQGGTSNRRTRTGNGSSRR